MSLITFRGPQLASYQTLLGFPITWPFGGAVGAAYVPNGVFPETLNAYWTQYLALFNTPPINANLASSPLEPHPYLNHPNYEGVNGKKKTIIIGTFPPFSYITSPVNPPALPPVLGPGGIARLINIYNRPLAQIQPLMHFFYGNEGTFWDYVPIPPVSLNIANCINWLNNHDCSITDIVQYCQRESLVSPSDGNLNNIISYYELIWKCLKSKYIDTLIFTSGYPTENCLQGNSAFSLFIKTMVDLDLAFGFGNSSDITSTFRRDAGRLLNAIFDKGFFWLKIDYEKTDKIFKIICLPSPSQSMNQKMRSHPFFVKWLESITPPKLWQSINSMLNSGKRNEEIANLLGLGMPLTKAFRKEIYEYIFNRNHSQLLLFQ